MRIYFCSDIHASRKCWNKFLNSWKFYEADHIVVGGDITGKFVVPIVERGGGSYTATFLGIERTVTEGEELDTLVTRVADAGQYPWITAPDEHAEPDDTANPRRSSAIISASPSNPGNVMLHVFGVRRAPAAFANASGTRANNPASSLSRNADTRDASAVREIRANSAALPSPTIPGTFSVPGRNPL